VPHINTFLQYDANSLQRYRGHEKYKMTSMANMHSPRAAGSDPAARQYTETYYVDIRSIFVGNLPADATEAELHLKFEEFGPIAKDGISLHKSESSVDGKMSFVYFL
jgi:RNA recognition motif-containing protein